jgi:hypothetical protein
MSKHPPRAGNGLLRCSELLGDARRQGLGRVIGFNWPYPNVIPDHDNTAADSWTLYCRDRNIRFRLYDLLAPHTESTIYSPSSTANARQRRRRP